MRFEKEFPLVKTKTDENDKKFDLSDAKERHEYFEAKAGEEIIALKEFFDEGKTFIAYLLGKKNAGKGTYTKLLAEIFGKDKIAHISAGDIVRDVHKAVETEEGEKDLREYLEENYRGYLSIDEGIDAILNRSQDKVSVPNEMMLTLIKREIDKNPGKSLFLDGFPRTMDQISYSFFFRDLINHREDPDLFIGIDIPETVIDARMKSRVVCPKCQSPRNLKLFTTKNVGYNEEKKEFYLICDNPECEEDGTEKMVGKEGDNAGIESIRARIDLDEQMIQKAFSLHGVDKILLRNAVPVEKVEEYTDSYEITPEYLYEYNEDDKSVKTIEKAWVVKDDENEDVYSLLPPPVVVSLLKQLATIIVR